MWNFREYRPSYAVPCDGNFECYDSIDEKGCFLPVYYLVYGLAGGFGFLFCFHLTSNVLNLKNSAWIEVELEDENSHFSDSLNMDFAAFHKDENLPMIMASIQMKENSVELNKKYLKLEMNHHCSESDTLLCIKVSKLKGALTIPLNFPLLFIT